MILLNRFRSSSDFSFSDFTLAEKHHSRQGLPPRDIATLYVDSLSPKYYLHEAYAENI